MSRKGVSLSLPAVLVVAGLALAIPAQASPLGGSITAQPAQLLATLWSWLSAVIPVGPYTDAGCNIDPDGVPHCWPATVQLDAGCDIDPNGKPHCSSARVQTDAGCHIDPDGVPRCTP